MVGTLSFLFLVLVVPVQDGLCAPVPATRMTSEIPELFEGVRRFAHVLRGGTGVRPLPERLILLGQFGVFSADAGQLPHQQLRLSLLCRDRHAAVLELISCAANLVLQDGVKSADSEAVLG